DNHYHLVIETPEANLSKGMRQLNGVFTQNSNRRHNRCGHLFQGRFNSIVVDSDAYLLELSRYVVLNPVRAGMVADAADWHWSSYRSTVGKEPAPVWLATTELLSYFSSRKQIAQRKYAAFVAEGVGGESIWTGINRQIYLGDDEFVARAQGKVEGAENDENIPRVQRLHPASPLAEIAAQYEGRNEAIVACYASGEYSYTEIAEHFGVCYTTVGRIVRTTREMAQ
ncbi:MAG: helix-turn-helix domain-containing protein, partial [Mariprofundaceae bacterium]|nr:helix-turn-helix domain-containing protein [Mariprofundaceae bacterium]